MSEKLERVKSRQDELIKLLPHDLYLDVYYLYEQAERVEELENEYQVRRVELLEEHIERLEKFVEELEKQNIKLKNNTDHRLSVENNNLKRENQRYRKTTEKIRDVMEAFYNNMINEKYALRVINDLLMEHYSLERDINDD